MKTSFYFVLWIIIYPILGLFHNPFINNNSAILAMLIVFGIAILMRRLLPDILAYESIFRMSAIMEDAYKSNIKSFRRRLTRENTIGIITAIYFIVTFVVIVVTFITSSLNDWVMLIIFALFTFGAIQSSVKTSKALSSLNNDPSQEECIRIVKEYYHLDYDTFSNAHTGRPLQEILPPRPRHFKVFQIVSAIIALVSVVLGIIYLIQAIALIVLHANFTVGTVSAMMGLYGTLAIYFGIRDLISTTRSF